MKPLALSILFTLLMIEGCASPGILIARQEGDAFPKMGRAPENGSYGLFIAGQSQELLDFPLKAGDPIGFERGNDGMVRWLYAVAGTTKNRLDVTQTYEWRRQP